MNQRIEAIIRTFARRKKTLLIATHSGKFHLDELLAITLVTVLADMYGVNISIRRTRDPYLVDSADLVLDVGGRNEGKYFDHHGKNFTMVHEGTEYKYATAGLVWDDVKDAVILHWMRDQEQLDPSVLDHIEELIFRRIILPNDITDNGQNKVSKGLQMTLDEIVCCFNDPYEVKEVQFYRALKMVQLIFYNKVRDIVNTAVEDARILQEISDLPQEHKDRGLMILSSPGPWMSVIKRHWDDTRHLKLCIYPDSTVEDSWKIQTLPGDKFNRQVQRCIAPTELRGYNSNDPNRSDNSWKDQLVFVHNNGFIGEIRGSLEDAISFAEHWIDHSPSGDIYIPTDAEYERVTVD